MSSAKKKPASLRSCRCIAKIDERLAKENLKLDLALSFMTGGVHCIIKTMKLDRAKKCPIGHLLVPTFCPFCGVMRKLPLPNKPKPKQRKMGALAREAKRGYSSFRATPKAEKP